jgi:phenylpyruvate tautomerase PptA (4-oxalocrotonate tautomerase family)
MTVVKLNVDPQQTPQEEAELVARVAAAMAEATGADEIRFELVKSESVEVSGTVAERMGAAARWTA